MKKIIALTLVVIMTLTIFTGCSSSGNGQEGQKKDTITFVPQINTETLDPVSGKIADHTVFHAMYDTIVKLGSNAEILPNLAESWTEADEGMSIIFNFREDIKFHDGSQFTAEDVIYSFDTMFTFPIYAQFKNVISSWEKIDVNKVKFTKTSPHSDILSTLAMMSFIVPKELHSQDPQAFSKNPIGTGAYRFVSMEADGSVKLTANEDYFGGKPEITNALIKVPLDSSTSVVALENNEVDMITRVPPAQIPIIENNKNLVLEQITSSYTYDLMMLGDTLSSDINLRKAIYHAIDREKVIAFASEGIGEISSNLAAERVMGKFAGVVDIGGYDESLAKDYLEKSSYDTSKVFKIIITEQEIALAQAVQADLKKIGIETEIEQLDINAWSVKLMGGEAEITITQLGGNASSVESLLSTYAKTHPYFGKYMASTNEFEELVLQINNEKNEEKRKELVIEGLQIQNELANVVPLFDTVVNFAHNKQITNISPISADTNIYYLGDFKLAQ